MIISGPNRNANSQIWYHRKKIGYLIPAIFDTSRYLSIPKVQLGRGQSTPFRLSLYFRDTWRRLATRLMDQTVGLKRSVPRREGSAISYAKQEAFNFRIRVIGLWSSTIRYGVIPSYLCKAWYEPPATNNSPIVPCKTLDILVWFFPSMYAH